MSGGQGFGARLRAVMDARGPLCVGVDPHAELLRDWGLADDASGLERFARSVVEAIGDQVAVIKPQSAFFERHAAAGIHVLERVVSDARAAGAIVLLDVKRGDIGSTMRGYAEAYLAPASPLRADAMTVSPYLGFESLRPVLDAARDHGSGVFVLTRTSNPEGLEVQGARRADGRTVAGQLFDQIAAENADAHPLGSVGAVVGATVAELDEDLSRLNAPLLAPGLGAQGAAPGDLRRVFAAAAGNVLPAASRAVLAAGPDHGQLRAATTKLVEECAAALG